MLTLPPAAFVPRRPLSVQERATFIEQRDRLFALCTPDEQSCLVAFAQWYGAQRDRLLGNRNPFSASLVAVNFHRHVPLMYARPGLTVRCLALGGRVLGRIDTWLADRLQRRVLARLDAMQRSGQGEMLVGVANYLRALPLQIDLGSQRALEKALDLIVARCANDPSRNPAARIDSVLRALHATPRREQASSLSKQFWHLLLDVAQSDMAKGLALVDTHWETKNSPVSMSQLAFYEEPELAYRLAVTFQPNRTIFAGAMVGASLSGSSSQLQKLEGSARDELARIMDASCRLLASWIASYPHEAWAASLRSIRYLLQYGNPADAYWTTLSRNALTILKDRDHGEQRQYFSLIAEMAFYAEAGSDHEQGCLDLFDACVERELTSETDIAWVLRHEVCHISFALAILDDKGRYGRNRWFEANPTHPLVSRLALQLDKLMDEVDTRAPASFLQHLATLALSLSNDVLARQYHEALRSQFAQRAAAFPADGGQALYLLIKESQRIQFSQSSDEDQPDICEASFDMLIALLDAISPDDAAYARSGSQCDPTGSLF